MPPLKNAFIFVLWHGHFDVHWVFTINSYIDFDLMASSKELLRYWRYMPYKGRHFNPRTYGKCFYFVICMISRHWFQTKLLQ